MVGMLLNTATAAAGLGLAVAGRAAWTLRADVLRGTGVEVIPGRGVSALCVTRTVTRWESPVFVTVGMISVPVGGGNVPKEEPVLSVLVRERGTSAGGTSAGPVRNVDVLDPPHAVSYVCTPEDLASTLAAFHVAANEQPLTLPLKAATYRWAAGDRVLRHGRVVSTDANRLASRAVCDSGEAAVAAVAGAALVVCLALRALL